MSPTKTHTKPVLAYDLGGTKVAVGVVSPTGEVLVETRPRVPFDQGNEAVLKLMTDLGAKYLADYPEIEEVGIASAGPLDPKRGVLLGPTNFKGDWNEFPIASEMSKRLGRPVKLENDAAAAMLAEHWVGEAKDYDNAMILTLGTGLGTGVITNGKLVRGGRGLHTEGGHIILEWKDDAALCACGNAGCAEAYLSGRSFERRFALRARESSVAKCEQLADRARKGEKIAIHAFEEYGEILSVAITSYVALFSPEIVVLTGSFAAASDLFLAQAERSLETRLASRRKGIDLLPKLKVSSLENHAGLIGAAMVAFGHAAVNATTA